MSPTTKMTPLSRREVMAKTFADRRCTTYGQLVEAIDARRRDLEFTMFELDERAGFHSGYGAKLICLRRNFGRMSLGVMLDVLNLEIVVRSRSTGECIAHAN